VISGLVVDNLSYEWLFWLGFGVVVIALVAVLRGELRHAGHRSR